MATYSLSWNTDTRREQSEPAALSGRTLYLPRLDEATSFTVASCFRRAGIEAVVTPPSDGRTRALGVKHNPDDACYPAVVMLGDLLSVATQPGFDPSHSAFLMLTAQGPCRLGQYRPCLERALQEVGCSGVRLVAPSDENGFAVEGTPPWFPRLVWRGMVAADLLRQALLRTRPYETVPGAADRAFQVSLRDLCHVIETCSAEARPQRTGLAASLDLARRRFAGVPAHRDRDRPRVGIVGEIFCRLNSFANDDLIRRLEELGAEVRLSQSAEVIEYSNHIETHNLRLRGCGVSFPMAAALLRRRVQQADSRALRRPFEEQDEAFEEPCMDDVLGLADRYLPSSSCVGEMVVNIGNAAWLAGHGADGVVDISPFSCMNGVVCEAIYPRLSRDHGGIPIRSFRFDGTFSDLDSDLGAFLELCRAYRARKSYAPGAAKGRNHV
jgi:predicted nucleotide-binding protein (sugar kinase/HSP70/actin superfamily)